MKARSCAKREVRPRTERLNHCKRAVRAAGVEFPEHDYWRPTTRGECARGVRPCPFVGCRYNLYLDVSETTGNLKLNFPDLEPWEMVESCALDVADRGRATFELISTLLNVTRSRAQQLEQIILRKLGRDRRIQEVRAA